MTHPGSAKNRQVVLAADEQQVMAKNIGNQWNKEVRLDIEDDTSRHPPMPVGEVLVAVREMPHMRARIVPVRESIASRGQEAGETGRRTQRSKAPEDFLFSISVPVV